jgi:type I restriction enzyme S subunit
MIPDSWVWVRLGEIGDWSSGSTPSRANKKYYENGTIPWLKTGDLNDDVIYSTPESITESALNENSMRLNPVGSILIAMYGATIGKVGILNIEASTNQACCACVTNKSISNKYLFLYLKSQKEMLQNKAEGGAQPNISKDKIINYPLPLPPLSEQKRIVAKIEQIFTHLDKIEQSIKA